MKKITSAQIAKLSLLAMSLNIPRGYHGYLEMLTKTEQPQPVTSNWLARLETVSPGISEKYWEIVSA